LTPQWLKATKVGLMDGSASAETLRDLRGPAKTATETTRRANAAKRRPDGFQALP